MILIGLMDRPRPQLNLFLFSVLLSDLVMTLVVMPLHAIHTATVGVAGTLSCSSWMYAHLMAICARWATHDMIHRAQVTRVNNVDDTFFISSLNWLKATACILEQHTHTHTHTLCLLQISKQWSLAVTQS